MKEITKKEIKEIRELIATWVSDKVGVNKRNNNREKGSDSSSRPKMGNLIVKLTDFNDLDTHTHTHTHTHIHTHTCTWTVCM
jgi:hypothetical protein